MEKLFGSFSDGGIAIVNTTMALELKVSHGVGFKVLPLLWPVFIGYALSSIYVGIYWDKLRYGYYSSTRST